jgi:3-isopropylmalate/(R)-2-methylmalate dehydratase small subunit
MPEISNIFSELKKNPLLQIDIDLPQQRLSLGDGKAFSFEMDAQKKITLLKGLDDIGLTLEKEEKISLYEEKSKSQFPWLWQQS